MAGPNVPSNLSVGTPTNPVGLAMDHVLTIAEVLGCKNEVASSGLLASGVQSLFDRI
jgi:hypothetical protein